MTITGTPHALFFLVVVVVVIVMFVSVFCVLNKVKRKIIYVYILFIKLFENMSLLL